LARNDVTYSRRRDMIREPLAEAARVGRRQRLDHLSREVKTWWRFVRLVFPYFDKVTIMMLLIVVGVPLAEIGVFLNRYQIDEVILNTDKPVVDRLHLFLLVLAMQFGLWAINHGFSVIQQIMGFYLNLKVTIDVKRMFYNHLNKLSLGFLRTRPVGEHMFRTESDTSGGREGLIFMITSDIPELFRLVYSVTWAGVLLSLVDWRLTAILLLYTFPYTGAAYYMYTRLKGAIRQQKIQDQRVYAFLRDGIAGFKEVKGFGRIRYQLLRYTHQVLNERRAAWKLAWLQMATNRLVLWSLNFLMTNGFWIYTVIQCMRGHLSYGEFLVTLQLASRFEGPLENLVRLIQGIRLQLVPAERVLETLDVKPDIVDAPDAVPMPPIQGGIEFRNVTFTYDSAQPALNGLNLSIKPGEKIALVGPAGAGKTTTLYLLLRLFEPQEGQILVDGRDIRTVQQRSLKDQLAVVLQETFLFGGTVADNIRYGNLLATPAQIRRAAELAGLGDFIESLPEKYDQDLAEGRKLSGGQRQRMGLARALARDPRILLLDEATAALDSRTEARIMENIHQVARGRTTIIISHRLITITDCDRILVMDQGRIVEEGTHEQLLQRNGLYKRMWDEQTRQEAAA